MRFSRERRCANRPSGRRAVRLLGLLGISGLAVAAPAFADGPVLHEYFPPDPREDVMLQATAMGSDLPAAIETPSGVARAPELSLPSQTEKAYGGSSTPDSVDSTYRVDSDTTRPDVVNYDDPFTPAVTPFKRLYACDIVTPDGVLAVKDKTLTPVLVGGAVQVGDDQFYGDLTVDLEQGVPVRIPTPGPTARVLRAHTQPPVEFKFFRDSADNWFVQGTKRARVRLVMQLTVSRNAFGADFATTSWRELRARAPSLPTELRGAAREVLSTLAISTQMSPAEAVARLVQHFRGFAPSSERPTSSGVDLYKELALSKKGVCRHRAYAFVISAIHLGVPSRMVRNEAHAWVEVNDGAIWHRIDLGGAAGRMEVDQDPDSLVHKPPSDPYTWPAGSESGAAMADRSRNSGGAPGGGSSGSSSSSSGADGGAGKAGPPPDAVQMLDLDGGAPNEDDHRPGAELTLKLEQPDVMRGNSLKVRGSVRSDGAACSGVRVDVGLKSKSGEVYLIRSISTDKEGRYDQPVTVPFHLGVGEYDVIVSTPGNETCGGGLLQ